MASVDFHHYRIHRFAAWDFTLFSFAQQANLVAAFEQSLALMTTRLQSLSFSHEQKVKALVPSTLSVALAPGFQLHSAVVARAASVLTRSEMTLIPALGERLNIG